jgi:hypothetical protein
MTSHSKSLYLRKSIRRKEKKLQLQDLKMRQKEDSIIFFSRTPKSKKYPRQNLFHSQILDHFLESLFKIGAFSMSSSF